MANNWTCWLKTVLANRASFSLHGWKKSWALNSFACISWMLKLVGEISDSCSPFCSLKSQTITSMIEKYSEKLKRFPCVYKNWGEFSSNSKICSTNTVLWDKWNFSSARDRSISFLPITTPSRSVGKYSEHSGKNEKTGIYHWSYSTFSEKNFQWEAPINLTFYRNKLGFCVQNGKRSMNAVCHVVMQ